MKNILHVQYTVLKQSTLYEQVDALETERTEENHATKKQNLTRTADKESFKPSKMLMKII